MIPRSLPARFAWSVALLVVISLLLGTAALARIMGINRSVVNVATNSMPSVVALNRIIQSTYESRGAVRRMLLDAGEGTAATAFTDAAFTAATSKADVVHAEYAKLLADAEERRLYDAASVAWRDYLTKAQGVVASLREGKTADARAAMRDAVDPALEQATAAMNASIDYNVTLAERQVALARREVAASFLLVGTALAAALILGGLVGAAVIRSTRRALGAISDSLETGATHTALASTQLASAGRALAEGCSEQSSAVTETSAALEEMTAMIRSTADNADKAKTYAGQAREAAQAGSGTMAEMQAAMLAIEASSSEVAKIVKDIDEIAFQTNILALNAAVEAARAGEAGAGFAVVADEVRSLAQRSAAAARETAEKIEAAIANSRRGSKSCGRVGDSLGDIVRTVAAADGLVAEIATAAREQAQGIRQVGVAMGQMDQVTQSNSASAEQSASAAEELKTQAQSLQATVDLLRSLAGGAARRSAGPTSPRPVTLPPPGRRQLPGRQPTPADRIPMPREAAVIDASAPDHEDRHFTSY